MRARRASVMLLAAGLSVASTACVGTLSRPVNSSPAAPSFSPGATELASLTIGVVAPEVVYEDDRWSHDPIREKNLAFHRTDRLIRLLRESEVFHEVDYVSALSFKPDLLAAPKELSSKLPDEREIAVAHIFFLGLLPTWGTRNDGVGLAFSKPDSGRTLAVDFDYPVQWVFGWPILFVWVQDGWVNGDPDEEEKSRSFRAHLVERASEIVDLARESK